MDINDLKFFFDKFTDKDITCFIYFHRFGCSVEEIAKIRNLKAESVKYSIRKVNNSIDGHLDKTAALEILFSENNTF